MGNTRIVYTDLNGDGIIKIGDNEVLQESHYYPFGMEFKGNYLKSSGTDYRYKYNDIERIKDMGLDVDFAFYRTLDPVVGRWWQVDPAAESFYSFNQYNSMQNNPVSFSDPNGDSPIVIGGAIGLVSNGISNLANGGKFFDNWDTALAMGMLGGAASASIGEVFAGRAFAQGIAHSMSGGFMTTLQGGNFLQGAASGGISSFVSSGIEGLGGNELALWLGGGVSGGIGSSIAGGSFLNGVGNGLLVGGLNHAAHKLYSGFNTSSDPFYDEIYRLRSELTGIETRIGNVSVGLSSMVGYSAASLSIGQAVGIQTNFRNLRVYNLYRANGTLNGNASISGSKYLNSVKVLNRVSVAATIFSTFTDIGFAIRTGDSRYAIRGIASGLAATVPYGGWALSYKFSRTPIEQIGADRYGLNNIRICFIEGTKITMFNGTFKNIEDIKIGDKVRTYNFSKSRISENTVKEVSAPHIKTEVFELNFERGIKVVATASHPFWVENKGWSSIDSKLGHPVNEEKLEQIELGDLFLLNNQQSVSQLKLISIKRINKKYNVYNLNDVDENHNFFANGILVHNKR